MNFYGIIARMNSYGYSWHVFQHYGDAHSGIRGFSRSFMTADEAFLYTAKVPWGIVYDAAGNMVVMHDYSFDMKE